MARHDDLKTLVHLEQAAARIAQWMQATSRDAFMEDDMKQSAVIRQLEIIGEAASRLSESFRTRHAELLPWHEMKGMRNILIHGYDEVDVDVVWETATTSIPNMRRALGLLALPAGDGT